MFNSTTITAPGTNMTTETHTTLPTGTWTIDPAQTTIAVTVKKLGVLNIAAQLTATSGAIEVDSDNNVTGVEVIANAGSFSTGNDKRDEHVLSADFLDADNHADLVFRTGKVSPVANGYRAEGTFTAKGQESPANVSISDVAVGADQGTFVATATLDRNVLGIDKMPSFVIGRELQLVVTATAALNAQ